MRNSKNHALIILFIICSIGSVKAQLFINEFVASNDNGITDASGSYEDWIEIYNSGTEAINLAGYYISDDIGDPLAWQIPDNNSSLTTIPAGGFLILWADKDTDEGADHIDIKLSSDGEDIILTMPDGSTIVDSYTYSTQTTDISFGRVGDGGSNWDFFIEPTPGASNNTDPGAPSVADPEYSISGGYYTGEINVELSVETEDAQIHYTLNGSTPTEDDPVYENTLTINQNTPLRAKAFRSPLAPSAVVTETYLFDINHVFPVVAYTADPDEMFDEETGMYPNFMEDIEIDVNAELYEPNGMQAFNQRFESEINGTGSAVAPQKSLALKAKKSLGSETIDYPIFPNADLDTYRSLILRNSGQDNNVTQFRDAMVSSLFQDLDDLNGTQNTILAPKLYGQKYRPGVTYINGEYWGITNIRERTDKRYIKNIFDLDDDEVDFLENSEEVKEGTIDAWNELYSFLQDNSLSEAESFNFVADRIDLDHYIDYVVLNLYVDNQDWPGNNDRRFRERVEGSQFRWLTYDLDFTFGLFVPDQDWNSGYNEANSLNRLLEPNGFLWPNPENATLLFRRLAENDQWRTQLANRMADQLNLLFNEERILSRIDDFQSLYQPEMQQHIDRWIQWLDWEDKIQSMRNFANGRDDLVRGHFIDAFDDINGITNLSIDLNGADQGTVQLNTITVHEENAPFTGKYFTGINIPLSAHPNRGFVFENWSGDLSGDNPDESINLSSEASITANFIPGSSSNQAIVINEINYNSSDDLDSGDWVELYNPNGETVDLSGWYFEDESGHFFGLPANTLLAPNSFLVLVADQNAFENIYPQVNTILGDFGSGPQGFGLSGGGEQITLKNAEGTLIDIVEYDDKSPWPTEPDGDGPTLQLIDPALDNSLPESWIGIPATPGAPNDTNPSPGLQLSCPNDFSLVLPAGQTLTTVDWAAPDVISICNEGDATLIQTEGPDNGSELSSGVYTVSYNATNPCGNEQNCSFSINVSSGETNLDYCDVESDFPWHDWIANVKVADINNPSDKSTYTDFTDISTNLDIGNTYDMILTTAYSWDTHPSYWRVWIDYNKNGSFSDPGELVFDKLGFAPPNGTPFSITNDVFTVPTSAAAGLTTMRVIMSRNDAPEPCGTIPFGEIEDYSVVLTSQLSDDNSLTGTADQRGFRFYPNPVDDEATIILEVEDEIRDIIIYNAKGMIVENIQTANWQKVYRVQTATWERSIYMIQVNTKQGRQWSQKMAVMRN